MAVPRFETATSDNTTLPEKATPTSENRENVKRDAQHGPAAQRVPTGAVNSMRHILSSLVMNQPGVLAHISGMLASRAFNIDSLAVGPTENEAFSRMTFVVNGSDRELDQVRKQLEKIVTVVKVVDYLDEDFVERDLMLIKVQTATPAERSQLKELTDIFRGRIVDVSADHVMIELAGQEKKIEAFIEAVQPFGIQEMARTGRIALARQSTMSAEVEVGDPTHRNDAIEAL